MGFRRPQYDRVDFVFFLSLLNNYGILVIYDNKWNACPLHLFEGVCRFEFHVLHQSNPIRLSNAVMRCYLVCSISSFDLFFALFYMFSLYLESWSWKCSTCKLEALASPPWNLWSWCNNWYSSWYYEGALNTSKNFLSYGFLLFETLWSHLFLLFFWTYRSCKLRRRHFKLKKLN